MGSIASMTSIKVFRSFIRPVRFSYSNILTKAQDLDKSSGFVKEDNSGKSNIFSTGEKALYSYSPAAEKAARQGLGGPQGVAVLLAIVALVGIAIFSIVNKNGFTTASSVDLTSLDNLTKIALRLS